MSLTLTARIPLTKTRSGPNRYEARAYGNRWTRPVIRAPLHLARLPRLGETIFGSATLKPEHRCYVTKIRIYQQDSLITEWKIDPRINLLPGDTLKLDLALIGGA